MSSGVGPPVAYHIAAGGEAYVKGIFAHSGNDGIHRLGIVIGADASFKKSQFDQSIKIVLVDPLSLTHTDVFEIFTYFFTSSDSILDKRRNRHEPSDRQIPSEKLKDDKKPVAPIVSSTPPSTSSPTVDNVRHEERVTSDAGVFRTQDQQRIGHIITDVFGATGTQVKERRGRKRKRPYLKAFIFFTIAIIILPILWYSMSLGITAASFSYALKSFRSGDTTGASRFTSVGNYWLHQGKFVLSAASIPFRVIGFEQAIRGQERLVSFLNDLASAQAGSNDVVNFGREVASSLFVTTGTSSGGLAIINIDKLRISLASVQSSLGLAQAQLSNLLSDRTFPFSFDRVQTLGNSVRMDLESARGMLSYVDHFLALYPRMAGFREPKTYLVLLQNSNELRPTGGFIGSIGILKFADGVISDFTIQDVYAVDGQLKGHVDPPRPISELLGQEHWYLRDSNWDPDFKASAERAIWFYEKETGTVVDGAIAVNVPFVVDLLAATGPITLSDYNDRITAENFFGKSIFYTMNNSFPGSTQKSDFLGTLLRALLTKVTMTKNSNALGLFRAASMALMRHDIMFMFDDSDLQNLVEHFGWAGRVPLGDGCEGAENNACLYDPLGFVEASFSVSKVNYFINRHAVRQITITSDGSLSETYSVLFHNSANASAGGDGRGVGGAYRTYTRVILPADASISEVTLDGAPVPTRQKHTAVPYKEKSDSVVGSFVLGIVFDVNPGTTKQLTISYTRSKGLVFGANGAVLDLLLQKQPGVSDTVLQTIIRYPIFWRSLQDPSRSSAFAFSSFGDKPSALATFLAKEGQLEYNTTILHDQVTRVRFTK